MPINCEVCSIKDICIFSKIKLENTKKLWNNTKRVCYYKNGDRIYNQGEKPQNMFILCSGKVKIYHKINGSQIITAIKTPGSLFEYSCICKDIIYTTTSIACENTIVSYFPINAWLEILRSDFDFSIELMKLMCSEIGHLQTRLAQIAYHDANEKIASTLITHIKFTSHTSKIPEVSGLKRTDIAEICGLRLETVVRVLKKFENKKIIKRKGNVIRILNIDALSRISKI